MGAGGAGARSLGWATLQRAVHTPQGIGLRVHGPLVGRIRHHLCARVGYLDAARHRCGARRAARDRYGAEDNAAFVGRTGACDARVETLYIAPSPEGRVGVAVRKTPWSVCAF